MTSALDRVREAVGGVVNDLVVNYAERIDSWVNLVTGVGTNTGRNALQFQRGARISDMALADLFTGDAYARRICRALPREALRRGINLHVAGDPKAQTGVAEKFKTLGVQRKLAETWTWGRCYGGALLWLGADDGAGPEAPLNWNALRDVHFATVVTKPQITVAKWYDDPLEPTFGTPELYRITRAGNGGGTQNALVHTTRCIRFDGALTPPDRMALNDGWCESELQAPYDKLVQFNSAFAAAGALLQDSSQGVFGVKGLWGMIARDAQDLFKTRMALMDAQRSVARPILIDKDDEAFTRTEVGALTGIPPLLQMYMLLLAGASDTPVTVLMGQSPAGMNATGESDTRLWYSQIQTEQANELKPSIDRIVRMILRSKAGPTGGVNPEGVKVSFPSLWEPTSLERATLRKTIADTDQVYVTMQALTPDEVATNRWTDDGYSEETSIDLKGRRASIDLDLERAGLPGDGADDATAGAAETPAAPVDPHAKDPGAALNGAQIASLQEIKANVAARLEPRSSGIATMLAAFPFDLARAEEIMGDIGKTFFTAPAPEHAAELDSLKTAHAQLQRSHQSTKSMLGSVLAKNRAGELVQGSPIQRKAIDPTAPPAGAPDPVPGATASGTDPIAVPPVLDALQAMRFASTGDAWSHARARVDPDRNARTRLDAGDGVAVVLPVDLLGAGVVMDPPGAAGDVPHCTLVYLGNAAGFSPDDVTALAWAVRTWAARTPWITGTFSGVGRFVGAGELDPVYLTPSCPDLAGAREDLVATLAALGFVPETAHGFIPHVCLQYIGRDVPMPSVDVANPSVCFRSVEVWAGISRAAFELLPV